MSDAPSTELLPIPQVSDYEIIRRVGTGAFGDVWLARAKATQRYRAIKLVCRSRFPRERLYETEFAGLKRFEEISREHAGFIDILHVSRNDQAGCFSYVMELADDLVAGQIFDLEKYVPRTLSSELERRQAANAAGIGRFTPAECVQVGLSITSALTALHEDALVHRDIKPSNIVFVRGVAKLADVGLVAELKRTADDSTLIGSPPFMEERVHGTAQGDLYGFGKVLYVIATGRGPQDWPQLPRDLETIEDLETFRELIAISRKACHPELSVRYKSAEEIHSELLLLRVGHSVRRLRRLERLEAGVKRFGAAALVIAGLAGLLVYQSIQRLKQASELRERMVRSFVAYGTRALDDHDLLGALPWFAEALREDGDNPTTGPAHRLRLGALLQQCPTIVQMWFTDRHYNFAQFAGHENQVLLSTPDRRWAVYDLSTGRMLYPPIGKGRITEPVSISPATGRAVTVDPDGPARLWNFMTGRELGTFSYDTPLLTAAISSDGRFVAAAAGSNVVVWEVATGQHRLTLVGHRSSIFSIAFSPDSHRLVTGGHDRTAIVWNLDAGTNVTTFTNHTGRVSFATFSPDGRLVATSSFDRSVRVWEAESRREVPWSPLWHPDLVRSVEFSADGARLMTAGLDGSVRVWDARTGKLLQQLRHNSKPVYAGFSPSSRYIVTACYDGTVRVWALRSAGSGAKPSPGVFSGDGACFAMATNQSIEIFDAGDSRPLGSVPVGDLRLVRVLLNRTGSRLLTLAEPPPGSASNTVQATLWDRATGRSIASPVLWDLRSDNPIFSPTGDRVWASAQGRDIVWDFERNAQLLSLPSQAQRAVFDLSGERLAAATEKNVQVWDLSSAKPMLSTPWPHHTWVDSLDWSPDGRYLVTGCWDPGWDAESGQVWDTLTGERAGPPLPHRDGVRFAAFSPDGRKVITCSEDCTAMLWDWKTGRQLIQPLRHKDQALHAAFSPDGRWVATACRDGNARVWDAETGEPITQDLPATKDLVSVQWVDGGRALLTTTKTGQALLWKLLPDPRRVEKLVKIAQLLSAERIHATESAMPETKEAVQKLWEELRSDYPADFSPGPD
jgi:WD40 repeat protein/serine/threonine protein kinase